MEVAVEASNYRGYNRLSPGLYFLKHAFRYSNLLAKPESPYFQGPSETRRVPCAKMGKAIDALSNFDTFPWQKSTTWLFRAYSSGASVAGSGCGARDTTPLNASASEMLLLFKVWPVTRSSSTLDFA